MPGAQGVKKTNRMLCGVKKRESSWWCEGVGVQDSKTWAWKSIRERAAAWLCYKFLFLMERDFWGVCKSGKTKFSINARTCGVAIFPEKKINKSFLTIKMLSNETQTFAFKGLNMFYMNQLYYRFCFSIIFHALKVIQWNYSKII